MGQVWNEKWLCAGLLLPAALLLAGEVLAAPAEPSKPSAVFSNTPAEITTQGLLSGGEAQPPCVLLDVRLLGAPLSATLATNGLGESMLALASQDGCPPDGDLAWAHELDLPLASGPQRLALRVSAATAADDASMRKGRIVAFGPDGELGSTEIAVRRAPPVPLWPELKWFVGFVLPAVVVFLFGRWTASLADRRQQWNELVVFRTVNKGDVDATVSEIKTVLGDKDFTNPGWQVLQSLRGKDVIAKLPHIERERLVLLCERNDLLGAVRQMKRLFPLHAKDLHDAAEAARKT